MKLAAFITSHIEEILTEWDVFAKSIFPVAAPASPLMLRDHSRKILLELTQDIETKQTAEEQTDKSKGQPEDEVDRHSAAGVHGSLRDDSGFSLMQLTSDNRALRATVFLLWMPHMSAPPVRYSPTSRASKA